LPYYHVLVGLKGRPKDAIEINLLEGDLLKNIVEPYRNGKEFGCGDEHVKPTDVSWIKITESEKPLALDHPDYFRLEYKDLWRRANEQRDVTSKFINPHPSSISSRKTKPRVPSSIRTKVLLRCKGKCENCGEDFGDLAPDIAHIDGNPMNNDPSNLMVLCPNCHRKMDKLSEARPSTPFIGEGRKFDLEKLLRNLNALNELSDPQTRLMLVEKIRNQTTDLPHDGMPHDIRNAISQLLLILKKEIGNAKMRRLCLDILHIVNGRRDAEVNAKIKELFLLWIEENYQDLTVEEKRYAMDIRQRLYEHNPDFLRELMLDSINKWSPDEFEKLCPQIEFDRLDKNHKHKFKVLLWKLRDEANKKQLDEKVQRIDKLLGLYVFE